MSVGRIRTHVRAARTASVLWVLAAAPALACPVCFNAREDVLPAFYGTAIALTFLPFLIIGSVGYGLHRRFRRAAVEGPGNERE